MTQGIYDGDICVMMILTRVLPWSQRYTYYARLSTLLHWACE